MNTTINHLGEDYAIRIVKDQYIKGGVALLAMGEEGRFGVITVNLPHPIDHDEIIVKTWSENEWVEQLLQKLPEHFVDTGKRVNCGYATAQIWKFKEAA